MLLSGAVRLLPFLIASLLPAQAPPPPPASFEPSAEQWRELRRATEGARTRVNRLAGNRLSPDVEIYVKAAEWLLRYPNECYTEAYYRNALALLETAAERAAQLESGAASWLKRSGRFSRGYRSSVDGSVQPYGLLVPDSYDGAKPVRLDVVLHGRGATLTEVSFLAAHDSPKPLPPEQDYIQLEVFGRTNNAYRWAGETDVFEALAAVREQYRIDPDRIVLRGFSMGGAGTWHIGLHYPDVWAAIEAGAGFTETRRYAKLTDLAPWQEKLLHIYDAVDYARNAFHLPVVGYGGDQDPQLQASLNMQERLKLEELPDLRAIFLVGPQTGHKFHPVSKERSERFIQESLGKPRTADRIRFVTYTTRYNRCFWISVDALERHYERSEVDADRTATKAQLRTANIARLTVSELGGRTLTIDGQRFSGAAVMRLQKVDGRWTKARSGGAYKAHGLQGPIDDAFMESFLCVRPGKPHPEATEILDRFAADFARWMRGDVRVKDDSSVSAQDIANHHLILFGNADTNSVIARIASRLPRKGNLPVLIYPNPLNSDRYVVLNSGHTFAEREFRGTNALLFPRLGDWAEEGASGFFNELWK